MLRPLGAQLPTPTCGTTAPRGTRLRPHRACCQARPALRPSGTPTQQSESGLALSKNDSGFVLLCQLDLLQNFNNSKRCIGVDVRRWILVPPSLHMQPSLHQRQASAPTPIPPKGVLPASVLWFGAAWSRVQIAWTMAYFRELQKVSIRALGPLHPSLPRGADFGACGGCCSWCQRIHEHGFLLRWPLHLQPPCLQNEVLKDTLPCNMDMGGFKD